MSNQTKINWDTWKLRCHAIGYVMGEPKLKKDKEAGNLSATAKSYLLKCYIKERFGREKDIKSKYILKGLAVEEDNITLYSRVKKKFFKKNMERLENGWICGEPDLFEGEVILKASAIIDMKSSWDIFTFYDVVIDMIESAEKSKKKAEKKAEKSKAEDSAESDNGIPNGMNPDYYWQGTGYMDLTGAQKFNLSYGLIDTPQALIEKEKSNLLFELGGYLAITGNAEKEALYLAACDELEQSMKYEDIPINQRLIELSVPRNDEHIELVHRRVEKCREYLKYLDDTLTPAILASYATAINAEIIE
jgi:hypothetical protein